MFTSFFTNTLLYLSLTRLIIKPKVRLELGLFTKQTIINKLFSSRARANYKQLNSFIALNGLVMLKDAEIDAKQVIKVIT